MLKMIAELDKVNCLYLRIYQLPDINVGTLPEKKRYADLEDGFANTNRVGDFWDLNF